METNYSFSHGHDQGFTSTCKPMKNKLPHDTTTEVIKRKPTKRTI